jgi:phosphoribosyl-AMP cyclohydrolase
MTTMTASQQPFTLTYDAAGLVPVVAQDEASGEVLLVAYMNAEALQRTLAEGVLVLWSRSRGRLWRKGEQSGHTLRVRELRVNCEGNSLLARVALEGPGACHEGFRSCYFRRMEADAGGTLRVTVVAPRVFDPTAVYGAPSLVPSQGGDGIDDTYDSTSPRGPIPPREGGRGLGSDAALQRDARELYAAHERLRDADEIRGSNTSKLLHAADRAATVALTLERARQELDELRGVIEGTHAHAGVVEDVILEASQIGYWTTLAAVAAGHPYDAWHPHAAWLAGWHDVQTPPATSAVAAELAECAALLIAAGAICRTAGVHPTEVVAADLAAMRKKHLSTEG